DRNSLRVLEVVNADFHRFDVFVRWPEDTVGPAGIERPQLAAFQDVHSGKILSWRVDRTPNARAVQLAIGDMVKTWGIPSKLLLDNGREFAAKSITGGTPTRFRFKVKDDDVPGLVTALGIEVIWATPYSGQSKQIERAFRDMCDRVAKHPEFAGAYTGNSPGAKPENYGSKAVELDTFLEVLTEEIELHNAKGDRRGEVACGRSFNEVFNEGYKAHPIRKATDAQLRMLMLGAEGVTVSRGDAAIRFMGNRYWAGWLHEHQGQKIVARFDPADLQAGLYVYAMTGEYLGEADCLEKTGFTDVDGARAHNRARRQWIRAQKDLAKAEGGLSPAEVAGALSRARRKDTAPNPDARVVRPLRALSMGSEPVIQPASSKVEEVHRALVIELSTGQQRADAEETANDRFRRALELEQVLAAGGCLTTDQARMLTSYRQSAEYKSQRAMWEDFGDDMFG
ncbi:MAG: transposase, partial [Pseudomonadota bacterium]